MKIRMSYKVLWIDAGNLINYYKLLLEFLSNFIVLNNNKKNLL